MHQFEARAAQAHRYIHSHTWLVGAAGLVVGVLLMIYVPTVPAVGRSILLFAGFHLVGAVIILLSAYSLGLRRFIRPWLGKFDTRSTDQDYDFGMGT